MICKNTMEGFAPKSLAASSKLLGLWLKAVLANLLPKGICRKRREKNIIQIVPVSFKGALLKARI